MALSNSEKQARYRATLALMARRRASGSFSTPTPGRKWTASQGKMVIR
jgi:hypothetical protein